MLRPPVPTKAESDIVFKRSSDGRARTPSRDWSLSSLALPMVGEPYDSPALQRLQACAASPACSCSFWLSPLGELVAQEHLPSSSCLRQGYLKAPHGAHRTCDFHRIRLSVLAPVMDVQPPSDLAHEHDTTRHVRSPAVPENKALLLMAPSDLSGLLPSVAFLANLPPVRFITKRRLGTTSPPPSVLHAGMLASLSGQAVSEFPSSV